MGTISRMRSKTGSIPPEVVRASGTNAAVYLNPAYDTFKFEATAAATAETLVTDRTREGRTITLLNNGTSSITLEGANAGSTTKDEMDFGATNDVTLAAGDVVTMIQNSNGVWLEKSIADN